MAQMYKVFFKESYFILTDDPFRLFSYSINHEYIDEATLKEFVFNLLSSTTIFKAAIYSENIEKLYTAFSSMFTFKVAAGGLVLENDKLLLIKRTSMFDLPKGHIEPEETKEQCALREVEEETNVQGLRLCEHLIETQYVFCRDENWFMKKTSWYIMTCPPDQELIPQREENIEDVFWLPIARLDSIIDSTYASLREVFGELLKRLMDKFYKYENYK